MPRSPFPGMDPYLEAPDLWQDVHTRLMTVFAEQLTPRLAPGYVAEVHTRLVIDRLMDEQPQILVVICNAQEWPDCDAWPLSVRHTLPVLPIPLLWPDPPVPLAVGEAVQTVYARARYDLRIDYSRPPRPALTLTDSDWASQLLAKAALGNG